LAYRHRLIPNFVKIWSGSPSTRPTALCVPQVRGAKPFGEPVIDWSEKVVGLLTLVLELPQASQADGGTEFSGFGLLAAGEVESAGKTLLYVFHLLFCTLLRS
jgi:hypothetical protein